MTDDRGYHPIKPLTGSPPSRPDTRTVTLTTAQCEEIIDLGRNELRQAERSVRELLHGVNERDLDEDEGEDLADARERVELWTGILEALEAT